MHILYFDVIDAGEKNFERIDPLIKAQGNTTSFLHFTSLAKTNYIDKNNYFTKHDISYYNTYNILKVLKEINPDKIITTDLSFILDRTLVNICKYLSIKLIYLSHGRLIDVTIASETATAAKKEHKRELLKKIKKRNIVFVINYLYSLYLLRWWARYITFIFEAFTHPEHFTIFPKFQRDLDADKILVYYENDKKLLTQQFNFPSNKIIIVGNPELDLFYNTKIIYKHQFLDDILYKLTSNNYFLYLEDGLVHGNQIQDTDWYSFINFLVQALKTQGKSLVIKLHPRTNEKIHEKFFSTCKKEVLVLKNCDFKNLIYHSDGVISQYSSTIIYALLLNKSVFCIDFFNTKFIKNYPAGVLKYCKKEEFEELLSKDAIFDEPTLDEFIKPYKENLDGNTIKRIVECILS